MGDYYHSMPLERERERERESQRERATFVTKKGNFRNEERELF